MVQRCSLGLLVIVAAGISACSKGTTMCTMEARSAIAVVVRDSLTGAGLAATSVAVVREDTFVDTLRGVDSVVSGAYERAGTYRVEVSSPGYRTWRRDGVRVGRDECHVQTVHLRAMLVRQ